jgi:hypothetical protein
VNLPINKGPDFTPSQWIAAAVGFFVSAGTADTLAAQGYLTRNWAVALTVAGFCLPPAIVRWLTARKTQRE